MKELLTLREVCEKVGLSRRMVHGYEKLGMVGSCGKNKYGYLLYDLDTVIVIYRIKKFREIGFSLKETKKLLSVNESVSKEMLKNRPCEMRQELKRLKIQIEFVEKLIENKGYFEL